MRFFKTTLKTAAGALALAALALAPAAVADQQILDDLIVQGSICAGFDCVNGESFGFDTLRLKENNLRVRFQDTSTSASFPSRDWELTANDSSNGGLNHFSITDIDGGRVPFRIEAGARTNALYVDDGGRIGLGTSNPTVSLEIKSGNTPTVRLCQDGSSGFTPQIWDLAGNEANFFIRDATNGSKLPFRIFPNADSNALTIEGGTGDIGIGTTSPTAPLHVVANSNPIFILENAGTASFDFTNASGGSGETWRLVNTGGTNASSFRIVNTSDASSPQLVLAEGGDLTIAGDVFSATCTQGVAGPCAPDYVFEPDYPLMPIAELAEFVASEKHLPNIPSEAEFRAQGTMSLRGFQMKLLEKIEELTLYTLQQQEEIDALTALLEASTETGD